MQMDDEKKLDEIIKAKIDLGKFIHNYNQRLIEMADAKASLIITFGGVLIGVSLYLDLPNNLFLNLIRLCAFLSFLASVLLSFIVVYPCKNTQKGEKRIYRRNYRIFL